MDSIRTAISETRIGSAAKGQRHETRPEELALIAQDITIRTDDFTGPEDIPNLFDGSCAHGLAVSYLGEAWGCVTWGNEIEKNGYENAALILDHATHGPQESLKVTGYFDIFFNNPPYDAGAFTRLEIEHVEQNIGWLRLNGIGIAVLPEHILQTELFWQKWFTWMNKTSVRQYPEPEFSRFKQYVVYGMKRHRPADYYTYSRQANEYAKKDWRCETQRLGTTPVEELTLRKPSHYLVYGFPPVTKIENSFPQGEQILEDLGQMPSIFDLEEWSILTKPPMDPQRSNPAMPLGPGHIVQVGAAGMFHGQEMTIDGKPYMVTGSSYKWVKKWVESSEEKTVTHHVEKPAYKISALNLEDGHFRHYDSHKRQAEYAAFLKQTTGPLIEAVSTSYPPRYQMDYSQWVEQFNRIHGPRVLPGRPANGLLTAQKHIAAAILQIFEEHKASILVGEMGTGKTMCSIATMAIANAGSQSLTDEGQDWRIVVMCPAVVAPKWVKEAETILRDVPGFKAFLIGQRVKQPHLAPEHPGSLQEGLKQLDDMETGLNWHSTKKRAKKRKRRKPILNAERAMNHDGPAMLVIPYQVAKNGSPWEHVALKKQRTVKWNEEVLAYNSRGEEVGTEMKHHEEKIDVFYCPDCGEMLRRVNPDGSAGRPWTMGTDKEDDFCTKTTYSVKRRCPYCDSLLYQDTPFSYGGRYPVAEYLSQHYGGQFSLIIDEAHNSKGGTTNIGMASQDLISGATQVIAMTGTIFNGYARSLFHLMYRLNPSFRRLYKYDEATKFAQQHGYADTVVTKSKRKSSAYGYSGYQETTRVDEAPGASPQMVAMLMPFTVFLTLDDIGVELPPYQEIGVPVEMSKALKTGYQQIKSYEGEVKHQFMEGNRGPLSQWTQAMLGWLDYAREDVFGAPNVKLEEDELLPKDATLVNLVKENLNEGRGVAVFFEQVNRRPAMERVKRVLEREGGIHAFILTSSVRGEERMPWIEEKTKAARAQGQEPVMLANGSLIKEGVDLLNFPTICEIGQHYNINTLRQRLRRSWRLGQDQDVRIYFLYYVGTKQESALVRIAKKLRAAHQVDGQVAAGIAAFEMDEHEFIQELMAEAEDLTGGRLAELMQTKVVKDVAFRRAAPVNTPKKEKSAEQQIPVFTLPPPVSPDEVVQLSLF